METVLLTVVEADDNKNQRSVNYFSKFFSKDEQINKISFASYRCKHHLAIVKLEHRHPDGSKFL